MQLKPITTVIFATSFILALAACSDSSETGASSSDSVPASTTPAPAASQGIVEEATEAASTYVEEAKATAEAYVEDIKTEQIEELKNAAEDQLAEYGDVEEMEEQAESALDALNSFR